MDSSGNFFSQVMISPVKICSIYDDRQVGQTASATLTLPGAQPSPARSTSPSSPTSPPASPATTPGPRSTRGSKVTLYADLRVRNTGQYPADAPLIVGSGTSATRGPGDGLRRGDARRHAVLRLHPADGRHDARAGRDDGLPEPAFLDPNRSQFTYDLVFLGKLNQAPAITSVPVVEALAGRAYAYSATATNADSDPLTFSLTTAPSAMRSTTLGRLTWSPTADDLGTQASPSASRTAAAAMPRRAYVVSVTHAAPQPPAGTSRRCRSWSSHVTRPTLPGHGHRPGRQSAHLRWSLPGPGRLDHRLRTGSVPGPRPLRSSATAERPR